MRGLSSVYLPLNWQTEVPSPPLRKHLPVDALAHLNLPLQEGLTPFPLVLDATPPLGTEITPPKMMKKTYRALRSHSRNMLQQDWAAKWPALHYYEHPPSFSPHPFSRLGKFLGGRIHRMRAGKSYLAAHPVWFDDYPDTTCPRCGTGPESFQHTMLTSPARSGARNLLLKEASSRGHDTTLCTDPSLRRALDEYIAYTKTSFPPDMTPNFFTYPSPPPPPPRPR